LYSHPVEIVVGMARSDAFVVNDIVSTKSLINERVQRKVAGLITGINAFVVSLLLCALITLRVAQFLQ
jgi:hypothetical protein